MHTSFWVFWIVPLFVMAQLEAFVGLAITLFYLPYGIFSFVGSWRATYRPTGSLWAPNVYRVALVLFFFVAAFTVSSIFIGE